MIHFCTYFNQYYLSRGLALHYSLTKHVKEFTLWVLCLDEATAEVLNKLGYPNLHVIPLAELESYDQGLLAVKPTRSPIEYYFTLTPALPLYLLERFPVIKTITYLDSDLFFYSDPAPLYMELGAHSVYIIPHRFHDNYREREKYGIYNVGMLIFTNDECGKICLCWWRERCLEWCYDRLEENRFADQKYLDQWPILFEGVTVSQHVGANLAPWNFANYQIVTSAKGNATVDRQPLIFYHFQSLRQRNWWEYQPNILQYGRSMEKTLVHWLYDPYIQILKNMYHAAKRVGVSISDPFQHARRGTMKKYALRTMLYGLRSGDTFLHVGF